MMEHCIIEEVAYQLMMKVHDTYGPINIAGFTKGIYSVRIIANDIISSSKIIKL